MKKVYLVKKYNSCYDLRDIDIVCVCATEELAKKKVEEIKNSKDYGLDKSIFYTDYSDPVDYYEET